MNRFFRELLVWLAGVGAVLAPASGASAQPSPQPDAVREKTAEVFSRPEFRPSEPGPGTWLLRQLRAFFTWLGGLYENWPALFWLILVGCLLALAALLTLMAFQIRSVFASRRERAEFAAADAERIQRS